MDSILVYYKLKNKVVRCGGKKAKKAKGERWIGMSEWSLKVKVNS